MPIKGTASLEVKNSKRNRELENFASLEPRVCEVLLYSGYRFLWSLTASAVHKGKKVIWGDKSNPQCQNDAQLVLISDFLLLLSQKGRNPSR